MTTPRQGGRKQVNINVSARATQKELVSLLEALRKIDPGCRFEGQGQYVTLIGSRDWNRAERRRMEGIFQDHKWKVKLS